MQFLSGIRVIESPLVQPVPKIQLSHDFNACSPEFKATFNRWLLDRFGTKEVVFVTSDAIFMSPKHAAMLRSFT